MIHVLMLNILFVKKLDHIQQVCLQLVKFQICVCLYVAYWRKILFFTTARRHWRAEKKCNALSGQLVTISNEDQHEQVFSLINHNSASKRAWFGLSEYFGRDEGLSEHANSEKRTDICLKLFSERLEK